VAGVRLEGPLVNGRLAPWLRAMAVEAAMELGVDAEQIIQETTIILTEAAKAGALGSTSALEAFLAQQTAWLPSPLAAEAMHREA
jgi:hypothetical protein